jgi:hypothetical protein
MDKHLTLNLTKEELYHQIIQNQGVGTGSLQAQTALLEMMFTELTTALNNNAVSANKLSKQLLTHVTHRVV